MVEGQVLVACDIIALVVGRYGFGLADKFGTKALSNIPLSLFTFAWVYGIF